MGCRKNIGRVNLPSPPSKVPKACWMDGTSCPGVWDARYRHPPVNLEGRKNGEPRVGIVEDRKLC